MKQDAYRVDTKPWYKYFWPWFALLIIFWTLMSGVGMVYFSSKDGSRSMVDGYNKLGKAAFDDKGWQKNAQSLGITATLIRKQENLAIAIEPPQYGNSTQLELVFIHPTDEAKDIKPTLSFKNKTLTANIPANIDGWQIKLRDQKLKWEVTNKFATRIQAVVKLR